MEEDLRNPMIMNILGAFLSNDNTRITNAQRFLDKSKQENLWKYVSTFTSVMMDNNYPKGIRQIAGSIVKNEFRGKYDDRKQMVTRRWVEAENGVKQMIRKKMLCGILHQDSLVRELSSRVVASIAKIDLPRGEFEIINVLFDQSQKDVGLPQLHGKIMTLGNLCQDFTHPSLASKYEFIIKTIFDGIACNNIEIKRVSVDALYHGFWVLEAIMNKPSNCAEVFRALILAFYYKDPRVDVKVLYRLKSKVLEIFVDLINQYYHSFAQFKAPFEKMTFGVMEHKGDRECDDFEKLVKLALLCWRELAMTEYDIICKEKKNDPSEEKRENFNIVSDMTNATRLCRNLTMMFFDQREDLDYMGVCNSAGWCLSAVSLVLEVDVVTRVGSFIHANVYEYPPKNIQRFVAGIFALSCITKIPNGESISAFLIEKIEFVIRALKHQSDLVRDTAIHCLKNIAVNKPYAIVSRYMKETMTYLLYLTNDKCERIAEKACCVVAKIANNFKRQKFIPPKQVNELSVYFEPMVIALFEIGLNKTGNVAVNAFEGIKALIEFSANDCIDTIVNKIVPKVFNIFVSGIKKLAKISDNNNQKQCIMSVMGNLCGVIQSITIRLGNKMLEYYDKISKMYAHMFKQSDCNFHIEMLLSLVHLAKKLQQKFAINFTLIAPNIIMSLQKDNDVNLIKSAMLCTQRVFYALGRSQPDGMQQYFAKFTDKIVEISLNFLAGDNMDLKPNALLCIGSVAAGIQERFGKYTSHFFGVINNNKPFYKHKCFWILGKQQEDGCSDEYFCFLRLCLVNSLYGVAIGSKNAPKMFNPYLQNSLALVQDMYHDNRSSLELKIISCRLLHVLLVLYGKALIGVLEKTQFLVKFIKECCCSKGKLGTVGYNTNERFQTIKRDMYNEDHQRTVEFMGINRRQHNVPPPQDFQNEGRSFDFYS
jgi:hypothetical protein